MCATSRCSSAASRVGGNAGSFVIDGIPGGLRQPSAASGVPAGRHGGHSRAARRRPARSAASRPHPPPRRWVHFPLKPFDLLTQAAPGVHGRRDDRRGPQALHRRRRRAELRVDSRDAASAARSAATSIFRTREKIWGLSAGRARSRTSQTPGVERVDRQDGASACSAPFPACKKPGAGRFFYPRHGYGQISDALHRGRRGRRRDRPPRQPMSPASSSSGGQVRDVEARRRWRDPPLPAAHVLSTIPVTVLARLVRGGQRRAAPSSSGRTRSQQRSMVLDLSDARRRTSSPSSTPTTFRRRPSASAGCRNPRTTR